MVAFRGRIDARRQRIVGYAPVRRNPDARLVRVVDAGRHDADNRVRLVVESDGLADGVRTRAEALPPEAIADNCDARRTRLLIGGIEPAPDRRLQLEHLEKV